MSKFDIISKGQFEALRAAAETEAQGILMSRYSAMRATAETEAQGILKSRNAAMRAAAETEAQGILKSRQQDFAEIHERWDDKLPKEFIDKVLNNINPYCSIEVIEDKIFTPWDNWLNSDDDDLIIDVKQNLEFENIKKYKKQKLDELTKARIEKDGSKESIDRWKSILNDLHDIDVAIRNGAKFKSPFKRKLVDLLRQILHGQLTPKEVLNLSDKIINDIQEPLVKHFIKVKTENKRKQQTKTALINVERDAKTKGEVIVEVDNNRKQKAKTSLKNADTDAKAKKKVVAKKPESEAKKTEIEARKAEAAQKRRQMEAEEDAKDENKGKRRNWGCISIIAIYFIYCLIPSSMKGCQEENESENLINTEKVETMLYKQFDYVNKCDNYFEVEKNNKYGFADIKGNVKIAPLYDNIGLEYDNYGVVAAKRDGKYGLVSFETFTEILEPTYDDIGFCNSLTELLNVRNNGKYGLFSLKEMKEVTPCIYDMISHVGDFYYVKKGKKSGYLNLDGSIKEPVK